MAVAVAVPIPVPAGSRRGGPSRGGGARVGRRGTAKAEVVLGAASVVGEDVVRVGRLAKPARGVGTGGRVGGAGVAVRVIPERAAAEGSLDLSLGGVSPDTQRLVVVAHRPPATRRSDFGRWIAGRRKGEGAGRAGVSRDERDRRRRRRRGRSACREFSPARRGSLWYIYWAEFALSPLNLSFHLLPTETPFG